MPEGWEATTLGDVADYQNGYPFKPAELGGDGLPVIRIKQLLDPSELPDRAGIPVPERHQIGDGDLIFSWSGTLAVRMWDRGPAALNQHLFRVAERPGVDRRWLALALDHAIVELNEKTHGSTMRHITKADLLPHPVVLPPLVVQRRVVDLVAAVDTYAAATTDQVKVAEASLGALRRMLIDESDAPLVDFSEVATIESALADPTLPGYRDLPHLGVDRIESRTGRLVGVQTAADDGVISGKFLFTEEDVIYSKIRPELRKAAFPRYEGLCSADAYPLRPAPGVDPHYLLELLLSDVFGDEAIGRSSRTKMPKINRRELADIRVPCPDPDEQRQIGELLHSVRVMRDAAAALGETLATIRSGLLEELLSGEREIPGSYDELVGLVA